MWYSKRSRFNYWSSSKLSKNIRKRFGLESPSYLSMDGWDDHEEYCKAKAPIIHWVTDQAFNKAQDVVYFIPDIIWSIRTANIWKFFRNLWLFRKALWNYRSWDYHGLLDLMQTATYDMHKLHRDHGHLVRSEETAKELLVLSELLKRIREDKYIDSVQGYKSEEGKLFDGEFFQKPNTLPSIKSKNFYKMREQAKKNDLSLACKLIERKLFTFWD